MIQNRARLFLQEDYRTSLVIQAKKFETVKQMGFPYRSLVSKLERWEMTIDEFRRLMERINKLNEKYGKTTQH